MPAAWRVLGPLRLIGAGALAALAALAPGCRGGDGDPIADATSFPDAPAADARERADAAPHAGEVWVMAWNLEQYPLTAATQEKVADLIATLSPDVLGVAEITDVGAFQRLVAELPDFAGITANDPSNELRMGLIYKKARVTVSDVETLFPADWYAFPRPPLKARLTVVDEGGAGTPFDFVFLAVHLKAATDNDSEQRRREACRKLDEYIRQQQAVAGAEQDWVLAGDWNDKLTDPPQYNVFLPFLDAPASYTFLTLPLAQAGDESTFIPFSSFIDHILITADAAAEYGAGETTVLHLDDTVPFYELQVSDHRPVLAKFRGAF
jgi:endonuclease/exonuclease/phosphatase family metal-dependent hydrolase